MVLGKQLTRRSGRERLRSPDSKDGRTDGTGLLEWGRVGKARERRGEERMRGSAVSRTAPRAEQSRGGERE